MANYGGGMLLSGPYFVNSGEVCSGSTLLSGATLSIQNGGQFLTGKINAGGTVVMQPNAMISGQSLLSGLLDGGTVSGSFSVVHIMKGGSAVNTETSRQGALYVSSGGVARNVTAQSGGSILVTNGGAASAVVVSGGGHLRLRDGAQVVSAHVFTGGEASIIGDATASHFLIENGATFSVSGANAKVVEADVKSGGVVTIASGSLVGGSFEEGSLLTMQPDTLIQDAATFNGITSGGFVSGASNVAYVGAGGTSFNLSVSQNGAAYLYGGTLSGGNAVSGGTFFLEDGKAFGLTASTGSLININGATTSAIDTLVTNNASMRVAGRGTVLSARITSGGSLSVMQDSTASLVTVGNAGQVSVASGGRFDQGDILAGGTVSLDPGGQLTGKTSIQGLLTGGTANGAEAILTVLNGGIASQVSLTNSAAMTVSAGGTASQTSVDGGALFTVADGGTTLAASIAAGGTMQVDAGGRIAGLVSLGAGAQAIIDVQAGGTVNLAGDDVASITLTGSGDPQVVITGFNGAAGGNSDRILLSGVRHDQIIGVTYPDEDHVMLQLSDGSSVTLHIVGVKSQGYALSAGADGSTVYATCFLAGSRIRTPDGFVAIEDIRPGVIVQTFEQGSMVQREVRMTGRGYMRTNPALSESEAGFPVRIAQDSLGDGVPNCDLLVTPEHCLFIEGQLIPARMLVNGVSITYDRTIGSYDYYHLATEKHAVIEANGVLTETYLDTGNSLHFSEVHTQGHLPTEACWSQDAAAPLATQRHIVEPIWRAIMERAGGEVVPLATTNEADVVLVDAVGSSYRPYRRSGNRLLFRLGNLCGALSLRSRSARQSDVIGPFVDDRRQLGVLVGRIMVHGAQETAEITSHLTDGDLRGWHEVTQGAMRWTDGEATLVIGDHMSVTGAILSIEILESGPYPLPVAAPLSLLLRERALCA